MPASDAVLFGCVRRVACPTTVWSDTRDNRAGCARPVRANDRARPRRDRVDLHHWNSDRPAASNHSAAFLGISVGTQLHAVVGAHWETLNSGRLRSRVGTMLALPVVVNRVTERGIATFVAGDHAGPVEPWRGGTLAIFVPPGHTDECGDFCQRALASGAVKRFITARSAKTWPEADFAARGAAYRLDRRGQCEAVKLHDGHREIPLSAKRRPPLRFCASQSRAGIASLPKPRPCLRQTASSCMQNDRGLSLCASPCPSSYGW